jgi:type II secretory pathway pseudopilin PulG
MTNDSMTVDPMTNRQSAQGGFTLVELIISMALMVLVMFGVQTVFSTTQKTVGAAHAMSGIIRDARAAQSVIYGDLQQAVTQRDEMPALIIYSRREVGFRSPEDQLTDFDYNPSAGAFQGPAVDGQIRRMDRDGDNTEQIGEDLNDNGLLDLGEDVNGNLVLDWGETTPPAVYNERNHRVDSLGFFARGVFPRQTGNDGVFVEPMSGAEAWIVYGHVLQPDFGAPTGTPQLFSHTWPGINLGAALSGAAPLNASTNPENFYASRWILGRSAMVLRAATDTNADGIGDEISGPSGLQDFVKRWVPIAPSGVTNPEDSLSPLSTNSESSQPLAADRSLINWSRYDLAGTTMADYRRIVQYYIDDFVVNAADPYDTSLDPGTGTSEQPWYRPLISFRHNATPAPTKPHSSAGMARTAPILLEGCTQFMVEYAGDYVTQNRDPDGNGTPDEVADLVHVNYGTLVDEPSGSLDFLEPDGETDFVVEWTDRDGDANRDADEIMTRTRWYGMPRDVAGAVNGGPDGRIPAGLAAPTALVDVVPLRDVLRAAGHDFTIEEPVFERKYPWVWNTGTLTYDPVADYITGVGMPADGSSYLAAWGPDTTDYATPQMLRIIVSIDDPRGRLNGPQTYEYVVKMP